MDRKVIVPLDGSKLAEVALPYAEEIAAKTGTDIILLSVLESDDFIEHRKYQTYIKRITDVTKYHMEKYLNQSGNGTIHVDGATRVGSPAEAIVNYADKCEFSLITMATHGRSGVGRWAVGSVADKVVRATSRQPVMLIRGKHDRSDVREKRILKKALVPLDGSPASSIVVPYIAVLASKLEMKVTLFQVLPNNHNHEDAEANLQCECRTLQEKGITAEYIIRSGEPADEIINLADELAFDVVAMSTRGRGGVTLWTLGSVAQKVLLGGSTPLLLVRQ